MPIIRKRPPIKVTDYSKSRNKTTWKRFPYAKPQSHQARRIERDNTWMVNTAVESTQSDPVTVLASCHATTREGKPAAHCEDLRMQVKSFLNGLYSTLVNRSTSMRYADVDKGRLAVEGWPASAQPFGNPSLYRVQQLNDILAAKSRILLKFVEQKTVADQSVSDVPVLPMDTLLENRDVDMHPDTVLLQTEAAAGSMNFMQTTVTVEPFVVESFQDTVATAITKFAGSENVSKILPPTGFLSTAAPVSNLSVETEAEKSSTESTEAEELRKRSRWTDEENEVLKSRFSQQLLEGTTIYETDLKKVQIQLPLRTLTQIRSKLSNMKLRKSK